MIADQDIGRNRIYLYILMLLICGCIYFVSVYCSHDTDFAAYYRAASIILDKDVPDVTIYETEDPNNRYNIPEAFVYYKYSMLVAYLMAPLALLPYESARAIMTLTSILAYCLSIRIIFILSGFRERWFIWLLAISFLWIPFLQDIGFVQINSILLFFIMLAVLYISHKRFLAGGAILGIAALIRVC